MTKPFKPGQFKIRVTHSNSRVTEGLVNNKDGAVKPKGQKQQYKEQLAVLWKAETAEHG